MYYRAIHCITLQGKMKRKMVIPEKLRSEVLDQYHRKLGHMGIEKTYGLIMRKYYWLKLFDDVVDHVKKCVMCQVQSRGS